jgi:CBS domain-containing protein
MRSARGVKELMNPDVMTVPDEMTTDELMRYLTEREISGAPVVDGHGHLVGVVSMTDVARHMADPPDFEPDRAVDEYESNPTLEDLGQRFVEERAVMVRDVMTPAIHHVPVTATAAEAARVMVEHHIHRLVVTQGKEPVGILTSMDLLRAIAEP